MTWPEIGEKFTRKSDGKEFVWDGMRFKPSANLAHCLKRLMLFTQEVDLWLHHRLIILMPHGVNFRVIQAFEDTEHLGLVLVIQSDSFPETPENAVPEMVQKLVEWNGAGPTATKVIHIS